MQFGEFFDCLDCLRSTFFETHAVDSLVHVWREVSNVNCGERVFTNRVVTSNNIVDSRLLCGFLLLRTSHVDVMIMVVGINQSIP